MSDVGKPNAGHPAGCSGVKSAALPGQTWGLHPHAGLGRREAVLQMDRALARLRASLRGVLDPLGPTGSHPPRGPSSCGEAGGSALWMLTCRWRLTLTTQTPTQVSGKHSEAKQGEANSGGIGARLRSLKRRSRLRTPEK